ncbi:MAG: carboxypeptidase regulatory-like domain-containing protein, partial [Candidatus Zixiibacteriota bacterium]
MINRCLVFSFAGLLLTVSSIQARILHVPLEYATIQAAIEASVSGDTVLVNDGIYQEHLDFLGKGIHVMTENGPLATIINLDTTGVPMVTFANSEDSASVLEGFSLAGDGSYWGIYCNGSSPTIYDNIIHAHEVGIFAEYGRPTVRKNEIISCAHQDLAPWNGGGMRLSHISGVLIDSNTIWYNSSSGWGAAIFMEFCDSMNIERNTIYSNTTGNVSAIGIDSSFVINVRNNLVLQNHNFGGNSLAAIYTIHGDDLIVENNIIAYNDQYGVGGTGQISIDYNVFFANSPGDINSLIPGLHNVYEDPLFVDYASLDFRIRGNSPCINAGNPESPPDPDGTRCDIGAYYAERGYIAVTVRDGSNQPIDGVYVTTTDTSEFVITGINGEYILGLPGNYEYDVFFTHPDYQELLVQDISVLPGNTASLDVNLTYSPTVLGEIEGIVVDSAGEPISNVNVIADYSGIGDNTDTLGYFLLSGLRPRSYMLFFTHDDYENLEVPGVVVDSGEITSLPPTVMHYPPSSQIIYVPEDFTTIQETIDNCHNGDTISVAPGTYYESLVFKWSNPVTVMARGDRDETILHSLGGTRIAKFSTNVDTTTVLKGFTIIGDTLSDGIYTTGGARPIIYGNIIKNCRCGIRTDCGSAVIRKNEIFGCRSHYPVWASAIRLSNAAKTVIDSNYIHDNFNEDNSIVELSYCGAGTVFDHNIMISVFIFIIALYILIRLISNHRFQKLIFLIIYFIAISPNLNTLFSGNTPLDLKIMALFD